MLDSGIQMVVLAQSECGIALRWNCDVSGIQGTRPNDLATSDAALCGDGNTPLGFPSSLPEQSEETASYPPRQTMRIEARCKPGANQNTQPTQQKPNTRYLKNNNQTDSTVASSFLIGLIRSSRLTPNQITIGLATSTEE